MMGVAFEGSDGGGGDDAAAAAAAVLAGGAAKTAQLPQTEKRAEG
jgi:hypothetical protein